VDGLDHGRDKGIFVVGQLDDRHDQKINVTFVIVPQDVL
jgi:hypothetical protein